MIKSDFDIVPGWPHIRGMWMVSNDHWREPNAEWHWQTNLGVALSIAGALTAAYKEGWGECWEYATGEQWGCH